MSRQRRRVDPEVYDRDYLLSENTEGFEDFRRGGLSHVKEQQLDQLELAPGVSLLEVGVGRGEFLLHCARRGAAVTGIDYSSDAVEISRETLAEFPAADLRIADCRQLPFEDDRFDRVYSGDVLEHQDFDDGVTMLREMRRVLKPGGLLLLHTAPNTFFTRGVYPLARPLLRRIDPATIEALEGHLAVNRGVHVHEYNLFSLRRVAREAGLEGALVSIGSDVLRSARHRHTEALSRHPLVRLAGALGRLAPFRLFLGNDLYLSYRK